MKVKTKIFGEVEIKPERIINFPQGLVAFEEMKQYFIIGNEDNQLPLCWLQSVDKPDLVFVLMDPFIFNRDYDFELSAENEQELEIRGPEDVAVFSIVVVPEDIKKMSANLLAPVIINTRTKKGKQIILQDKRYSTRHFILDEMQKKRREGVGTDAGADEKKG